MKKLFYLVTCMAFLFLSCETEEKEPQLETSFNIDVGGHQWNLDIDSNKNYILSDDLGFHDVISKDEAIRLYKQSISEDLTEITWTSTDGFHNTFISNKSESVSNDSQRGCQNEYIGGNGSSACYVSYCLNGVQTNWEQTWCCNVPGVTYYYYKLTSAGNAESYTAMSVCPPPRISNNTD